MEEGEYKSKVQIKLKNSHKHHTHHHKSHDNLSYNISRENSNNTNERVHHEKKYLGKKINREEKENENNKKGLKYHPKNKKEKEHKLEPIHICDKIIKDPQKFFTVKVFDNLLKSYNIKGIENNENKKNQRGTTQKHPSHIFHI